MRKKIKLLLIAALALGAILLVAYRLVNQPPSKELSAEMQVREIMETGGCLACHALEPQLPFYASFPIAKQMLKQDVKIAQYASDFTPMYDALAAGTAVSEVDVAKMEQVALQGLMPPARYYMVHWGSSINAQERTIILNWAKQKRKEFAYTGLASEEFSNEPVRPVPDALEVDMAKVTLGNKLFHDTRLSVDNTVSCATCHGLHTGGVDNKPFSEGVSAQLGGINAPTVYNAVFNFVQFWDGRAHNLAAQAAGPPLNPVEMAHESFDDIVNALKADKELSREFLSIYPEITEATITDAIAEFEKTLITPNCRFDRYLKGENDVLTAQEIEGYELFKQMSCATCHVGVNLGGQSYERMGIVADYFAERTIEVSQATLTEDKGRHKETKTDFDLHRFKTPTLRNVALTWPYFHDASMPTLTDAVEAMVKYQKKENITQPEVENIVAFLNTLTGEFEGKLLTNENEPLH